MRLHASFAVDDGAHGCFRNAELPCDFRTHHTRIFAQDSDFLDLFVGQFGVGVSIPGQPTSARRAGAATTPHIRSVVSGGADSEMCGIHASVNIAGVKNTSAFGYRAFCQLIGNTVRRTSLSVDAEVAVARVGRNPRLPKPTIGFASLCNLAPKAREKVITEPTSGHLSSSVRVCGTIYSIGGQNARN
jgi:hypothetical protein